jgi:hypothetical protein
MLFASSLTLFLGYRGKDNDPRFGGEEDVTAFPSGQLTSTAWEGWWHDER